MPRQRQLIRLVEIAQYLGVSKQRAHQLSQEGGFPSPAAHYRRGRLWSKSDIKRWARDSYEGGSKRWGSPRKACCGGFRGSRARLRSADQGPRRSSHLVLTSNVWSW
jgi:predicted DNA-binding transcriptional regulator AlpA